MESDLEKAAVEHAKYSTDRLGRSAIHIEAINVGDRIREDLGDIDDFARAIHSVGGIMQPIVLDNDNNLIAGGRRLTAYTILATNKVETPNPEHYQYIPYVRFGSLTTTQRKMLELEENFRRKDMTWQERVIGLADYHRSASLQNDDWSQEQTGRLLGVSQASVSIALQIEKALKDKSSPVWKLDSAAEALKFLIQKKLDEATVEVTRRIKQKRDQSDSIAIKGIPFTGVLVQGTAAKTAELKGPRQELTSLPMEKERITKEELSSLFVHGDCIIQLTELRKITKIHHLICDPPYATDMANLNQDSVIRIEETHQPEPNRTLLHNLLLLGYDVIEDDGFLCLWYDLDMHQQLLDWADQIGWRICRWPFTWCKTSNCQNKSPMFNITKATEQCMFLRKSEKSVIKEKKIKNFVITDAISSKTHPFIKPDAVWRYIFEAVSLENQICVDPFCGEGSMLLTGLRMNRQVIGIEKDDIHISNGIDWLHTELNQKQSAIITDASQIPL